ncbi:MULTISPECIES: hypothetical protein [unclassified Pseudoalteromonas]|jgi:hypothetical protein|uniref:hypothetical protein n=1 Tax=unclassified Pseudoalteromonas TaxID=194690 RepID=UPI0007085631|nr:MULTISPECIES: hypothetical protein [unclassified Pseudoalteromonas]KPV95158.1 hypothetical protein AN214_02810 [Pseudoalteromonas sp. P1-9]MCP4056500.1 hypothetical protein [Pseudoalteromonas sp.]MDC9502888.1 hypothetical protein [Pseudoalteromonas sp. Angola-18]|tara:strand:+ start:5903 stop:6076 length:174 start_codon:yes stop_codon:yes gene_type:complete
MKLSELIKQLQEIEKSVPFDSEVVTGEDWMPQSIVQVYHEPPYTFIQFEPSSEDIEE